MAGYNNTYKDNLILVVSADHKNAMRAISELNDYLATTQTAMAATASGVADANTQIAVQEKAVTKTSAATKRATAGQQKFNASLMSTSHSFRRMTTNMTTGNTALDTLSMRLDRASMFMWRFNIAMIPLQQIEFQLAAIAGGLIMLEKAAIETYRQAERMRTTFMGMGDGAQEASDKVDFLLQKAKELPFTFSEVTGAAMAFRTSGLASSTEEMERWIDAAADMAAAASTDVGHNIATAAEAMVDAVNGEMRRLRNTYHISSEEMAKFGDDAKTALFALIETKWGGVAEIQMKSLEGAISNFIDSLTRLGVAFGENLKDPLMLFLGMGEKVVDTLTAITKAMGSVGGGAAIAAALVPIFGILLGRIVMTYIQIQGLKGAYLILTRNVGSLYTVMSKLAEAMNRMAVAEADEISATGVLNSTLIEQIGVRNALSKAIAGQAAATEADAAAQYARARVKFSGPAVAGVGYSKGGATPGSSQMQLPGFGTDKYPSFGLLKNHPMYTGSFALPGTAPTTLPGMSMAAGVGAVGKDATGLAMVMARDLGTPVKLFEKYAQATGRSVEQLTKAEIVSLSETAKRIGILEAEAAATNASTSANAAKAASERAVMDNVAKNILLQQKFEKYGIGNVFGKGANLAKGALGALSIGDGTGLWNGVKSLQGHFLNARLAINSTAGAIGALTAASMAVPYAINAIKKSVDDSYSAIKESVEGEKARIEALRTEGMLTRRSALLMNQRIDVMKAEQLAAQESINTIAGWKTAITILTGGIALLIPQFHEWGRGAQSQMAAASTPASAPSLKVQAWSNLKTRGSKATNRFLGRETTAGSIYESIANQLPYQSPENPDYVVPSDLQKSIGAIEAEIYAMEKRNKEFGATARQIDALDRARQRHGELLAQEARAERDRAIFTEDADGVLAAERKEIDALNQVEQARIDILGRELNIADSHMGYLKQMGISGEEYNQTLREQYTAHEALAAAYKRSGDEAKYWQHTLAAAQLTQEYLTVSVDKALAAQDRHIARLRAERAAQWELYDAELARYNLANQKAAQQRDPEKQEQERIDALERMQQAYEQMMTERAAVAGAMAQRAEIQSVFEDKSLDPAVIAARRRAAEAERDAAVAQGSQSGIISAENRLLQIERDRVDAIKKRNEERAKEKVDIQDAYYQLSETAREHKLITQQQADAIKRGYIGILQDRIRKETDVADRIRMQTELIKLQAKESGNAYDDIIRRIIGGPEAVDQAISMQMMARRFGPGPASPMSSFRVVNQGRDTLTIELGPNTAGRLRQAVSGAASEAFIRSFIEEIVTRLRS